MDVGPCLGLLAPYISNDHTFVIKHTVVFSTATVNVVCGECSLIVRTAGVNTRPCYQFRHGQSAVLTSTITSREATQTASH